MHRQRNEESHECAAGWMGVWIRKVMGESRGGHRADRKSSGKWCETLSVPRCLSIPFGAGSVGHWPLPVDSHNLT